MIDGLVGVFVMVGVTTFMAALVELGSFVLAPPASLEATRELIEQTPELQATVSRFSAATGRPAAEVKAELAARLCELPRDASGINNPGCRGSGFTSSSSSAGSQAKKWRCDDVGSWERAQELLKEGHSYLDRDKDGEACEALR